MQGLFQFTKGTGEPEWTYEDYEDTFGDGSNLSNPQNRELFEVALADRLFDHRSCSKN